MLDSYPPCEVGYRVKDDALTEHSPEEPELGRLVPAADPKVPPMTRARFRLLLLGNQHGVALPLAMLALVILTVLSLAFMALSKSEPIIASNQARAAAARSLAESGLERALWALTTSVIPATLSGVAAAPYLDAFSG